MEVLNIEGTSYTPEVCFDVDNNVFSIEGDSRPEDTHAFYKTLIDWLADLKNNKTQKDSINKNGTHFKIRFDYLNSSSSKFVLKMLMCVKDLIDEGFNFKIDWIFDEPDIDMRELGEEYIDMTGMDINLIAVEV